MNNDGKMALALGNIPFLRMVPANTVQIKLVSGVN